MLGRAENATGALGILTLVDSTEFHTIPDCWSYRGE